VKVLALSVWTATAIARLAIQTSADVRLVALAIDWIWPWAAAWLALHLIALHAVAMPTDVIHARRASCSTSRKVRVLLVSYQAARVAPKTIQCVTLASGRTIGRKWMVEQNSRQMVP